MNSLHRKHLLCHSLTCFDCPSLIFKLFLVFILVLIEIGQAEQFEKWMLHCRLSVSNPALWDLECFLGCNKWIDHDSGKMGSAFFGANWKGVKNLKMNETSKIKTKQQGCDALISWHEETSVVTSPSRITKLCHSIVSQCSRVCSWGCVGWWLSHGRLFYAPYYLASSNCWQIDWLWVRVRMIPSREWSFTRRRSSLSLGEKEPQQITSGTASFFLFRTQRQRRQQQHDWRTQTKWYYG